MLAVTVADFCYKGPENAISEITSNQMITYYVTCNGTNPLSPHYDDSRSMVNGGGVGGLALFLHYTACMECALPTNS